MEAFWTPKELEWLDRVTPEIEKAIEEPIALKHRLSDLGFNRDDDFTTKILFAIFYDKYGKDFLEIGWKRIGRKILVNPAPRIEDISLDFFEIDSGADDSLALGSAEQAAIRNIVIERFNTQFNFSQVGKFQHKLITEVVGAAIFKKVTT